MILLDIWTFRQLNFWITDLLDNWSLDNWSFDNWTSGQLNFWKLIFRQLIFLTTELFDIWTYVQLSRRSVVQKFSCLKISSPEVQLSRSSVVKRSVVQKFSCLKFSYQKFRCLALFLFQTFGVFPTCATKMVAEYFSSFTSFQWPFVEFRSSY